MLADGAMTVVECNYINEFRSNIGSIFSSYHNLTANSEMVKFATPADFSANQANNCIANLANKLTTASHCRLRFSYEYTK